MPGKPGYRQHERSQSAHAQECKTKEPENRGDEEEGIEHRSDGVVILRTQRNEAALAAQPEQAIASRQQDEQVEGQPVPPLPAAAGRALAGRKPVCGGSRPAWAPRMNNRASPTVTAAIRSTDGVIVMGDADEPPNSRNPCDLSMTWATLLPTGTPPRQGNATQHQSL